MNRKNIIAVLGVVVVILIGTTVYFATINKAIQPVSAPKVVEQTKPAPTPAVQRVPESAKPAFDKKVLQDTVFSAVDSGIKIRNEKQIIKDLSYAKWGNKVDITSVDPTLKAAKGKWYDTSNGDWDWISWQQDDSSWKVLLSFDGFSCTELKGVPSQYDKFFQDVVYFRDTKTFEYKKQNCY